MPVPESAAQVNDAEAGVLATSSPEDDAEGRESLAEETEAFSLPAPMPDFVYEIIEKRRRQATVSEDR